MTAPYANVGPKLVERGYSAIPIMPGTKRPGQIVGKEWIGLNKWREIYGERQPIQDEIDRWSESEAGVGVVCGKGLAAVDIDSDDPDVKQAILNAIPNSHVVKVGAKGATLFFRAPWLDKSVSWNIEVGGKATRACDLIGPGRQTLLPPTVHMDTKEPYRWIGTEALENVDIADLPELPEGSLDAIGKALVRFGWKADREHVQAEKPFADSDSPHRGLNQDALANLHKWVPDLGLYGLKRTTEGYRAVASWRPSGTGKPLEKREANVGISWKGIEDFGECKKYTPINMVMAAQGCDLDTAFKFLTDRLWEMDRFINVVSSNPQAPVLPDSDDGWFYFSDPDEEIEECDLSDYERDLERLTYCNGAVGSIINWVCETSKRPNRILALGTAVATIGTLIGRRVWGPTYSATHLYVVGVAPTGSGKEHPLQCVTPLMECARADHHISKSGSWTSVQAMVGELQECSLMISLQDEWGQFLQRINGKRASGFEAEVSKALKELWSKSFAEYKPTSSVARRAIPIQSPAFSILAMSTPQSFYSGIRGDDIEGGFLNRLMVLRTERYVRQSRTDSAHTPVPEDLARQLTELYNWGCPSETPRLIDPAYRPVPHLIPWASSETKNSYYDFVDLMDRRMRKNQEASPFLSRTAELAIRLATIMAAGRWGRDAEVDDKDLEWGIAVASNCTERMIEDSFRHMNKELTHGALYNSILEMLNGNGQISRERLFAQLGGSVRSARDIDQQIEILSKGAKINEFKVTSPDGSQEAIWYKKRQRK